MLLTVDLVINSLVGIVKRNKIYFQSVHYLKMSLKPRYRSSILEALTTKSPGFRRLWYLKTIGFAGNLTIPCSGKYSRNSLFKLTDWKMRQGNLVISFGLHNTSVLLGSGFTWPEFVLDKYNWEQGTACCPNLQSVKISYQQKFEAKLTKTFTTFKNCYW